MPRYHAESQRAAGPARRSPTCPNGAVTPLASKPASRHEVPHRASGPTPAAQTASRDIHAARSASAAPASRRSTGSRAAGRQTRAPLRSRSMPVHGVTHLVASWWTDNDQWITAAIALAVTFALVLVVDRALARNAQTVATRLAGGTLTPEIDTRLRFLRRVVEVTIVLIGVGIALAQFASLSRLIAPFLASGAIFAAIVGFASRTTLGNAVAGLLLAVTQPLRIGDQVTFEGETGMVEDVRLTYTYLRTTAGARIVIPNERLAAGILRNDTVLEPTVGTEVALWLAPEADALRAIDVLHGALPEARATVAEVAVDGTRRALAGEPVAPSTKAQREADLRAHAYGALRAAGLR